MCSKISEIFLFPCALSLGPQQQELTILSNNPSFDVTRDHRGRVDKTSVKREDSSWWESVEGVLNAFVEPLEMGPLETREELQARMHRAALQQQKEQQHRHCRQLQMKTHYQHSNDIMRE